MNQNSVNLCVVQKYGINIPGTPVFAHYTSARRWYAPHDLAKVNNSEIERVTEVDIKKKVFSMPW